MVKYTEAPWYDALRGTATRGAVAKQSLHFPPKQSRMLKIGFPHPEQKEDIEVIRLLG